MLDVNATHHEIAQPSPTGAIPRAPLQSRT
jgi:hypothetical protein